jgi:O-antigen ligase
MRHSVPALGDLPSMQQPALWGRFVVMLALLLPWINPFAPHPSSPVVQSLLSVLALAMLLVMPLDRSGVAVLARTNAAVWLAAALLSGLMALVQYFGAAAAWFPWINGTAEGEAFANLRQRNQFATLTNIGLLALVWWQSAGRPLPARGAPDRTSPVHWAPSALALSAAALLAVGNAASSSRTGLLQLVLLSVLLLGWMSWRTPQATRLVLVASLSYVLAVVALPLLAGFGFGESGMLMRLQDVEMSCGSRTILWRNVLHLIGLRPWTGWGWGELDYAHFITLYPGPRFCDILDNAHNLPLQLAVELGVPVALLVCGLALYLLVRARPWHDTDPTRQLAWGVLGVIGLHSLLEYPLWYGPFQLAFGVAFALLCLTGRRFPALPSDFLAHAYSSRRARLARAAVAIGLVIGTAHAAMDYVRVRQFYLPLAQRIDMYRLENLPTSSRAGWFGHWLDFAELTTTAINASTAARMHEMAERVLHVAPEPRVIEKLIDSAVLLGREDQARYYLARYQAAFPQQHADWLKRQPR